VCSRQSLQSSHVEIIYQLWYGAPSLLVNVRQRRVMDLDQLKQRSSQAEEKFDLVWRFL
jgi:hypothetical protein